MEHMPVCVMTRKGACVSLSSGALRACPKSHPAEGCRLLPEPQAVPDICAVMIVTVSLACPCTLPSKLIGLMLELNLPMEFSLFIASGHDDSNAKPAYQHLREAGIKLHVCYGDKCHAEIAHHCKSKMMLVIKDTVDVGSGVLPVVLTAALQMPGSIISPSIYNQAGQEVFGAETIAPDFGLTQVEALPILCLLGHTEDFRTLSAKTMFDQTTFTGPSLFVHRSRVFAESMERLEAQPTATKNVLFIDGYLPTPDKDSGSRRTSALISLLMQQQHRVTFQAIVTLEAVNLATAAESEKYKAMMIALGARLPTPGLPNSWSKDNYEVIIVSRRSSMTHVIEYLLKEYPDAGIIYDTVDLHFLRETRLAMASSVSKDTNLTTGIDEMNKWLQNPANGKTQELTKMRELELSYMKKSHLTVVVSPYEAEVLKQYIPSAPVVVISNIVVTPLGFDMQSSPTCRERTGILFVGQFGHTPNQQAIDILLKYVIPDMLKRSKWTKMPDIHIVGSGKLPVLLRQRISRHSFVHLHSDLSDLELQFLYMESRVAIAPLVSGAGVKGKINQAMSLGVPVVATSVAVEGMHITHNYDCMVAETLQQFIDYLEAVYFDDALCNSLAQHAFEGVYKHFSMQEARSQIIKALDRLAMVVGHEINV